MSYIFNNAKVAELKLWTQTSNFSFHYNLFILDTDYTELECCISYVPLPLLLRISLERECILIRPVRFFWMKYV